MYARCVNRAGGDGGVSRQRSLYAGFGGCMVATGSTLLLLSEPQRVGDVSVKPKSNPCGFSAGQSEDELFRASGANFTSPISMSRGHPFSLISD